MRQTDGPTDGRRHCVTRLPSREKRDNNCCAVGELATGHTWTEAGVRRWTVWATNIPGDLSTVYHSLNRRRRLALIWFSATHGPTRWMCNLKLRHRDREKHGRRANLEACLRVVISREVRSTDTKWLMNREVAVVRHAQRPMSTSVATGRPNTQFCPRGIAIYRQPQPSRKTKRNGAKIALFKLSMLGRNFTFILFPSHSLRGR